jgi:hypothetical protein
MHDTLPEGEELRRAVRWVSDGLQDSPGQPVQPLVKEAIFKFDLSPKDAEFLVDFFHRRKEEA